MIQAAAVGFAAVAVGFAVTAVVHRVIAPAELLTPADHPYPTGPTRAKPGIVGTLIPAPLIVDGRLRVYASRHQVRADHPVDARTPRTPYWSYRRWPAQLSGVVAAGTTVVSHWSDGELVALDARNGHLIWRAAGPQPGQGYTGRRTGAATLYTPPGLHTGTTRDGRAVIVASGASGLHAYELASGRKLWRDNRDPDCRTHGFTGVHGDYIALHTCHATHTLHIYDLAHGTTTEWRPPGATPTLAVTPIGCGIARSSCLGLQTSDRGQTQGWLLDPGGPVRTPTLDTPAALLTGETVVTVRAERAVARSARTGTELWHTPVPDGTTLLAAQPGRLHLLTADRELITVDPATGRELSRYPLAHGPAPTTWTPGLVHAGHGYLAIERLAEPVNPAADDDRYYLDIEAVLLART
ncbi:MAG TPA: PQQ-binding-like beta-propeller repeat protein [Micromonosporaceae bacterium]